MRMIRYVRIHYTTPKPPGHVRLDYKIIETEIYQPKVDTLYREKVVWDGFNRERIVS